MAGCFVLFSFLIFVLCSLLDLLLTINKKLTSMANINFNFQLPTWLKHETRRLLALVLVFALYVGHSA